MRPDDQERWAAFVGTSIIIALCLAALIGILRPWFAEQGRQIAEHQHAIDRWNAGCRKAGGEIIWMRKSSVSAVCVSSDGRWISWR